MLQLLVQMRRYLILQLWIELRGSLRGVRKLLKLALAHIRTELGHAIGLVGHRLRMTITIGLLVLRERGVLDIHHAGASSIWPLISRARTPVCHVPAPCQPWPKKPSEVALYDQKRGA